MFETCFKYESTRKDIGTQSEVGSEYSIDYVLYWRQNYGRTQFTLYIIFAWFAYMKNTTLL